jgi:pyruvate/2-oxoglutarate dehydrogenase complex dihydrolipoamide dehydrogenase (E3) component
MATSRGKQSYDLVVIGAGAAGSTAAFEAIGRGANVALIERWKVGGTCLNAGCDPTKTLVRSAEVLHLACHAARFGVTVGDAQPDWPAVIARVERVIDTIRGGDGDRNIRDAGIALYKGAARFSSPQEIAVDGEVVRADKVIVATGATPVLPPAVGLAEAGYLTNVEAVALPALPTSLAIIGGGVIAVEFAQIFARFGVAVTILAARGHLLPREEPELTHELRAILAGEGIRVETGVRVDRVEVANGVKRLTGRRGEERVVCEAAEILLAAGRRPSVAGLGLEAAGIAYSADGIVVDAELRTTAPQVWAVGDVIGGDYPFTHVADYQARIAEHNALSGMRAREVDYRAVPWVVFTDPELARVGWTEAEARREGYDVKVATVRMTDIARAITTGETDGLVKLVADRVTGRILGGHVLAARGGELLGEIALALRLRLPAAALAETLHAYPTLSEGVFWAAYELAKPDEPAMAAVRGVQAPWGEVPQEM